MSLLLSLVLAVATLLALVSQEASAVTTFPFRPDGTFTIVQIADVHYSSGSSKICLGIALEEMPCSDLNTTDFIARIMDGVTPDLVVFTGDNIQLTFNADNAIRKYSEPVIARQIPWAMIFGNHDDEGNLDRQQMLDIVKTLPYAVSERGPLDVDGIGNYALSVADGNTTLFNLFLLDSGAYSKVDGIGGYDWVKPSQIKWFLQTSQDLNAGLAAPNPALAFFHIPIPEYEQAVDKLGSELEGVHDGDVNSGLFAAFLEAGDVKATFVGHDHINDYCGDHFGVKLCYGGGIGYGTYGRIGFKRRARIIKLENFGKVVRTWKVLDDLALTQIDSQFLVQ